MERFASCIRNALRLWETGKTSDAEFVADVQEALDKETEYVTLDDALSAGRREGDSGCDLGRA